MKKNITRGNFYFNYYYYYYYYNIYTYVSLIFRLDKEIDQLIDSFHHIIKASKVRNLKYYY